MTTPCHIGFGVSLGTHLMTPADNLEGFQVWDGDHMALLCRGIIEYFSERSITVLNVCIWRYMCTVYDNK